MHFSLFSNLLEISATPTTFTVMIAVLACILGAEIAGIGILISKMVQARESRTESSLEDGDHSSRNYAIGMLLFLGTVPQSTYVALSVLVTATATLAVLFVVLLVIFRACGYETVSSAGYRDEPAEVTEEKPLDVAEPAAQTNEEDAESVMQEDSYVVDEEQHQDAYTAVSDAAYEDPFAVLDEMPADDAASDDALSCEEADEEKTEMTVVTTTTEQSMDPSPAFADGTQPYKVVEKVVTETVKEIYKKENEE